MREHPFLLGLYLGLLSAKIAEKQYGQMKPERNIPKEQRYMERTLVLLKPDCVQRRLMGRIIARFEDKNLEIAAMKMMRITPELARRHYAEHVQKAWYPELEAFITGGPVVAMIVAGPEVIRMVREMAGVTNGLKAAAGTIRGDFSASQMMNLVHASDGPDSARREIGIFFPEDA
jgi:nucleoside-diphosphate kinase